MAQDLAAFHTASSEMGHQQHSHHLVTTETRPLTLVATSNGTQIAVQVSTVAAVLCQQQRYCQLCILCFMNNLYKRQDTEQSVSLSHLREIAVSEGGSKRPTLCSLLPLHIVGEFLARKIKLVVYIPVCTQPAILTLKIKA